MERLAVRLESSKGKRGSPTGEPRGCAYERIFLGASRSGIWRPFIGHAGYQMDTFWALGIILSTMLDLSLSIVQSTSRGILLSMPQNFDRVLCLGWLRSPATLSRLQHIIPYWAQGSHYMEPLTGESTRYWIEFYVCHCIGHFIELLLDSTQNGTFCIIVGLIKNSELIPRKHILSGTSMTQ